MFSRKNLCTIFVLFVLSITQNVRASIKPANLFTHNMVLQQQTNAAIWGWADAKEKVTVTASWGESANSIANTDGYWSVRLKTPPAIKGSNETHQITFTGESDNGSHEFTLENILVGEVWLASGQSNMAYTINAPRPVITSP